MSLILTVIMMLSLAGCGRNANLSSVSRDPADSDGTVWFDEEAVALAGSVQRAGMSEAEIARANELRTMATDALALVNAKRAENGLAELTWSNGLESCAMVRAQEAASKFSHTRPNGRDWYTVNSELMWGENLAKGYDLDTAVEHAKAYISGALGAMLDLGKGSGPMDHGFDFRGKGFAEERV